MEKCEYLVCGYIYDPEKGNSDNEVDPNTAFTDLTDNWVYPVCGESKDQFKKKEE
jgi:rubredoxin